jgi:hypothetical protein
MTKLEKRRNQAAESIAAALRTYAYRGYQRDADSYHRQALFLLGIAECQDDLSGRGAASARKRGQQQLASIFAEPTKGK